MEATSRAYDYVGLPMLGLPMLLHTSRYPNHHDDSGSRRRNGPRRRRESEPAAPIPLRAIESVVLAGSSLEAAVFLVPKQLGSPNGDMVDTGKQAGKEEGMVFLYIEELESLGYERAEHDLGDRKEPFPHLTVG